MSNVLDQADSAPSAALPNMAAFDEMTLREERPVSRGLFKQFATTTGEHPLDEHQLGDRVSPFPRTSPRLQPKMERQLSRGQVFWQIARGNILRQNSKSDGLTGAPTIVTLEDRGAEHRAASGRGGRVRSARAKSGRAVRATSARSGRGSPSLRHPVEMSNSVYVDVCTSCLWSFLAGSWSS
jgi:hypothetical protein